MLSKAVGWCGHWDQTVGEIMRVGILAEKLGMSRYYDKNSSNQAVTLLRVSNCKVISIQSNEKNGYSSVTLSHGKSKNPSKPFKVFLKKNNLTPFNRSREFRIDSTEGFKVGDEINVSNFMEGQYVDVSANSIGKGFAGGMKRHNFVGNRATMVFQFLTDRMVLLVNVKILVKYLKERKWQVDLK